jgi:phosphoglycolate phosphatase
MMNLLFDLDGTLTDSRTGINKSIQYAMEKLQLSVPSENDLVGLIGPPLVETFGKLLPDPTTKNIEQAIVLYRERFADVGIFENSVYPGIQKALENFREMGVSLYLATSKPQIFAQRILAHFELDHLFKGIYGSEFDGTRQDKTELIRYLLETEEILRQHTTMIGDRYHDIKGGKANNLQTVGVLWGYGNSDELIDAGADLVIDEPDDLNWLMEFYSGE